MTGFFSSVIAKHWGEVLVLVNSLNIVLNLLIFLADVLHWAVQTSLSVVGSGGYLLVAVRGLLLLQRLPGGSHHGPTLPTGALSSHSRSSQALHAGSAVVMAGLGCSVQHVVPPRSGIKPMLLCWQETSTTQPPGKPFPFIYGVWTLLFCSAVTTTL